MQSHNTTIKVRGYHLDFLGHVNNARYLEFLEEARWSFHENQPGIEAFKGGPLAMVVANININFRAPAFLEEELRIETTVKDAGKRSLVIRQTIQVDASEKLVVEAEVTVVVIDRKTQKAVPLEGPLRDVLLGPSE